MTLVDTITNEVTSNVDSDLHPKISALVGAFVTYLKEPRYQNPLTLSELATLFKAFYKDLYGLVFNIYAQLTQCKRQLIQNSLLFASDLQTYDYLNAIAHYSSSHIKLVKRSDPQAAYQLRVFAFYKAATILRSILTAIQSLFASVTPGDRTELYDKIFRFDLRDLSIQELLTEKLAILRKLSLPLSAFCENQVQADAADLDEYFLTLSGEAGGILDSIKDHTVQLNRARTPSLKLQYIVKIQKSLIDLCAGFYNNDSSKVNNDILLPALIYIIIYHPPEVSEDGQDIDLYLNFTFLKNFCEILDPYNITASNFALNSSLSSYSPTEKKESFSRGDKILAYNFFELINLKESNNSIYDEAESDFQSDAALIGLLQRNYFNTGEILYYLTNFEAILFFLVNTPLKDIVPEGFMIPKTLQDKDLVTLPLHLVLEARESKDDQNGNADTKDSKKLKSSLEDTEDEIGEMNGSTRSRSSSLFNTLSTAVSQTVNRSRSNSTVLKSQNRDVPPTSFEESLTNLHSGENFGMTPVRKFLGRIGQASGVNLVDGESIVVNEGDEAIEFKTKRSLSLFDVFSPVQQRNRSVSVETGSFLHSSNLRKPTITTKFLNGVSELITKLNVAANASTHSLSTYGEGINNLKSTSREDSLEDYSMNQKSSGLSERNSSMDKWFNNIGEHSDVQTCANSQMDSAYNEGSLFSASYEELTKYHHVDFDALTMKDLIRLKGYYDQLCNELLALKSEVKTSLEYLAEELSKEHRSI